MFEQRLGAFEQRPGNRAFRRHGHLSQLHARWALRLSAEDLLTNYCVYDCVFCVNRVSSDIPRARFTPEEVVALTLDFYRRNYIEGLFLSSGIFINPDHTMEEMNRVARALRSAHHFGGYIHLKTIPGAAKELIEEAGRWADRVSVNIELPTQADLDQLAPEKKVTVIETAMQQIHEKVCETRTESASRYAPTFAPAGQTTQMVIGATAGSDAQILPPPANCMTHTGCGGFTTPGSVRIPMRIRVCRSSRHRWCASIASTRQIG